MKLFRSGVGMLLLSVAPAAVGGDCAKTVHLGVNEDLCLIQELVGEEFILTVSKINRVTGSPIHQAKVENVYAVLSPDAGNVLFCTLANGWMSSNSFSILDLSNFLIRPLRLQPEPVDEVTCRFDATGQVVVVFDEFPGRNNAYVYSSAAEHIATVKADNIDRLNINNRVFMFNEGLEFGGVGDAF